MAKNKPNNNRKGGGGNAHQRAVERAAKVTEELPKSTSRQPPEKGRIAVKQAEATSTSVKATGQKSSVFKAVFHFIDGLLQWGFAQVGIPFISGVIGAVMLALEKYPAAEACFAVAGAWALLCLWRTGLVSFPTSWEKFWVRILGTAIILPLTIWIALAIQAKGLSRSIPAGTKAQTNVDAPAFDLHVSSTSTITAHSQSKPLVTEFILVIVQLVNSGGESSALGWGGSLRLADGTNVPVDVEVPSPSNPIRMETGEEIGPEGSITAKTETPVRRGQYVRGYLLLRLDQPRPDAALQNAKITIWCYDYTKKLYPSSMSLGNLTSEHPLIPY